MTRGLWKEIMPLREMEDTTMESCYRQDLGIFCGLNRLKSLK